MTISQRTATGLTASTDSAPPYDNVTYTLPTGHTTNDLLMAFYGAKDRQATAGTPSTYTANSGGTNGTTASGVDLGSVYSNVFTKVHSGSESNPSSTVAYITTPAMVAMQAFYSSVAGTAWSVTSTYGDDADATGTTSSCVGSATLDFAVGDVIVVQFTSNNDRSAISAGTVSASGITFGTFTQELSTAVTNAGNDGQMSVWTATVTAGSGTTTPTFTGTMTSGFSSGRAIFLRIREPQTKSGSVTGSSTTSGTVTGTKADSPAYSGTVTGSSTSSGTVAGKKGGTGSLTASSTSSGTVAGSKAGAGSVTASSTSSGSTAGNKGGSGSVTGSSTSSGTVTGTASGEAYSGSVTGSTASSGTTAGSKGGAGSATGANTSSGTEAGRKSGAGSVTGDSTSAGNEAGSKSGFGSTTGSSTSSGTVTGAQAPQFSGTVTGSSTSAGTTAGSKQGLGVAAGSASTVGTSTGTAARTGTVDGSSTSTGTVGSGSKPGPQPEQGGGYLSYQRAPRPVIKHASGRVRGLTFPTRTRVRGTHEVRGRVRGRCTLGDFTVPGQPGYSAQRIVASQSNSGRNLGRVTEPRTPEYIEMDELRRRLRDEMEIAFLIEHRVYARR